MIIYEINVKTENVRDKRKTKILILIKTKNLACNYCDVVYN